MLSQCHDRKILNNSESVHRISEKINVSPHTFFSNHGNKNMFSSHPSDLVRMFILFYDEGLRTCSPEKTSFKQCFLHRVWSWSVQILWSILTFIIGCNKFVIDVPSFTDSLYWYEVKLCMPDVKWHFDKNIQWCYHILNSSLYMLHTIFPSQWSLTSWMVQIL